MHLPLECRARGVASSLPGDSRLSVVRLIAGTSIPVPSLTIVMQRKACTSTVLTNSNEYTALRCVHRPGSI